MLSPAAEKRVRAEAERRGIDPDEAVAEARRLADDEPAPPEPREAKPDGPTRPLADRLLIGFLPFIKVKELRSLWLGLPDSIPDDDMTCGDYTAKHGGGAATAPVPEGAPE